MTEQPTFALTVDSAPRYLERRGFVSQNLRVTELSGGVSNVVLLVEHAAGQFVLKQASPQLRVQQEWFSDIRRIFTECSGLRTVRAMLPPGSVPDVIFEDQPNYLFAMTAAPEGSATWKSRLLAGNCDLRVAATVASMLGAMIRGSWGSKTLAQDLGEIRAFEELRLDPYYSRLAQLYPDLGRHFEALISTSRTRRVSLVHGDWSPKNILVKDGRAMAIDFEVLHFGDPSFDAAFLLNHLLLKTFHGIAGAAALADVFWATLQADLPDAPWFEAATIGHLGALLLARMDGKSPAEYIRSEQKDSIRAFARRLITNPPQTVGEVWRRYDEHH